MRAGVLAAVEQIPIDRLREMMERGDAVRKILAELPFVKAELAREEVAAVVGGDVADDAEALAKVGAVVAKVTGGAAAI